MKKFVAMLLVLTMALSLAACASGTGTETTAATTEAPIETTAADVVETTAGTEVDTAMTHDEYMAADLDTPVTVECYVQATQSWWDNKITVYAQAEDGAYFLYEMACPEEAASALVPGAKIRVTGYKSEWAGEVEIVDATFEMIDSAPNWVAEPLDATALLGTDALIDHQNERVKFTGLTVEAIEYKNGEPGDDIYVTVSLDGQSYNFCVEAYLTGPDTEVYGTVGALKAGDVVDIEGFLYWYEGVNPHITAVTVVG